MSLTTMLSLLWLAINLFLALNVIKSPEIYPAPITVATTHQTNSGVILVNIIIKVGKIEDRDQNWRECSKYPFQAFEKVSRGLKMNLHVSKMAATRKGQNHNF